LAKIGFKSSGMELKILAFLPFKIAIAAMVPAPIAPRAI